MSAFWNSKKKSAETDSEGHVLVALWADYEQAVSLDRQAKQVEILSKIKSEASEKRLAWDFYDAAKKYVSDAASRNWKLQDSLKLNLGEEIAKFDEPVMSFVWKLSKGDETAEAIFEYVRANAKRLEASCNQQFWTSYDGRSSVPGIPGSGFVKEFYANDYQYALWTLLAKTSIRASRLPILPRPWPNIRATVTLSGRFLNMFSWRSPGAMRTGILPHP